MDAPAPASPRSSSAAPVSAPPKISSAQIISAMVRKSKLVSDLIFSPGSAPRIEIDGQLVTVEIAGLGALKPAGTMQIATDLIGENKLALQNLRELGSCDISYSLPELARFRVNIFMQRGTCAIVMRVIPNSIPTFADLRLPPQLADCVELRNGIVLVTGPTGSGKSSTLAAILNRINEQKAYHIITIEDPIEFLHLHKKSIIHQRELHSDTPSFALALRAALRQAPKVILVGEMRDKDTIEIALEAAETGHLVFSTLHTIDASRTIERILGAFPLSDQQTVRNRLAKCFRYIISQRLVPRKDDAGRLGVFEILKSTLRTREYVERGEGEGKTLVDAMRDGVLEGMQHFDSELERHLRAGTIDIDTSLAYATNPGNFRLQIADFIEEHPQTLAAAEVKGKPVASAKLELMR